MAVVILNICRDVQIYVIWGCFALTLANILCHSTRKFKEELEIGVS